MISVVFKEKEHSKFSPSASSRWLLCNASIIKEQDYLSEYKKSTLIGILLHEMLAESLIKKDINIIADRIGNKYYFEDIGKYFTFTENYFKSIYSFYEYFISNIDTEEYEYYVEEKVNFDKYMVDGYGYVDCYLIKKENNQHILDVFDYKTGYITINSAYDNKQLMIYTLGIIEKHGDIRFDKINIHIVQPSRKRFDSWSPSIKELEELGRKMNDIYHLVENGEAKTNGGDSQCQYCKARKDCLDSYNVA